MAHIHHSLRENPIPNSMVKINAAIGNIINGEHSQAQNPQYRPSEYVAEAISHLHSTPKIAVFLRKAPPSIMQLQSRSQCSPDKVRGNIYGESR